MARADFCRLPRSLDVSRGDLSVSHASSLTCQYETVVEGAKVKPALNSHDVTMQTRSGGHCNGLTTAMTDKPGL